MFSCEQIIAFLSLEGPQRVTWKGISLKGRTTPEYALGGILFLENKHKDPSMRVFYFIDTMCVKHSVLCLGRNSTKEGDICICRADSLLYTAETNTPHCIKRNYTNKNKKINN